MTAFKTKAARAAVPALALGMALASPAVASAHEGDHGTGSGRDGGTAVATVQLRQLNHSGAFGQGALVLRGNQVDIAFRVRGVLADAPHAQHIHIGAQGRCPSQRADTSGDGIVNTTEGHPFYGHIGTSLTTNGDTSPGSGLAVDRFPTPDGTSYNYRRSITVTADVASNIRNGKAVLVVHGIDPNRSGAYDGSAPSDLDPSLPLEATSPAACGPFQTRNGGLLGLNLDLGIDLGLGLGRR
ncbi:hypothetical protein SAMN05216188_11571 [Lentzea xinjiangensis]|uniref:CHRD domain-containing protein n=1 Tax=Lentzea xinjiangensis TaxID=402600 RepID=A0A1H9RUU4_9PSEU|nr:hypothetical protein [Lentzea xinjiangensis]SER76486.1 hypothetical protein SAMN05216188_11571 [Lentzea xinjiangensis]